MLRCAWDGACIHFKFGASLFLWSPADNSIESPDRWACLAIDSQSLYLRVFDEATLDIASAGKGNNSFAIVWFMLARSLECI